MQKTTSNPPVVIMLLSLTVLVTVFVIHACRKLDRPVQIKPNLIQEKFFNHGINTHPTVVAIAEKIKRQDKQYDFVSKVVDKAGYPLWDKAKVSVDGGRQARQSEEGEQQIFIPFVIDSIQQTKAMLTVKIDGTDTAFRILYTTQYAHDGFDSSATPGIWSAQEVFRAFAVFDNEIYGHTKFAIKDSRLFGTAIDTIGSTPVIGEMSTTTGIASARLQSIPVTIWVTFMFCDICFARQSQVSSRISEPCCNVTYHLGPVLFWVDEVENFPGGDWWTGGGGGGDCNSGCECPGCNWTLTNPCEEQDPNQPQVPCDDQWTPVPENVPDPYDVNKFDSVYVDESILDSFPCVYKLITEDMYDINKVMQRGFDSVFMLNKYEHVRFTLDYSLVGSKIKAQTWPKPTYRKINGNLNWVDTIGLNPAWLNVASRESIVGTIVHEMVHAFINWCFAEYTRNNGFGQVDSNYLKNYFPMHWAQFKNEDFNPAFGHDVMATKYVDYFTKVILKHGNQNAPLALREWVAKGIAQGGLFKSIAWGKPGGVPVADTANSHLINFWAWRAKSGPNAPASSALELPNCPITYPSFRDSLQLLPGDSCQ